jgi:membrane protease subunit HflC
MKRTKLFLGILLVFLLAALWRSVVIVDETEWVLVTEFGRPVRVVDRSGLTWKWPHQSARAFDRRLQLDTPPPREMLTKDKKNLEVAWYVSWKIADVEVFLRSVRTLPDASARLEDMAASVIAAKLVGSSLTDLVRTGGPSGIEVVMNEVKQEIAAQARTEYGLTVVDVRLRRLNYPEEVRAAVFEQIRSERQRVAAATRAEGDSQARTIRSAADLQRARILAEAEADAARVLGEGEAEAARIANEAHAADPQFYQFLKTLEAYRAALDARTTLVLSADSAFLRLLTQGVPDLKPAPNEPKSIASNPSEKAPAARPTMTGTRP